MFLAFCIFLSILSPVRSNAADRNPYPNELSGYKFYSQYMAPLLPKVSDHALVAKVLGSDKGLQVGNWRLCPYFEGNISGTLALIEVTPKHRVRMRRAKFSTQFEHRLGAASEINLIFDIYADSFGLEYWIHKDDSAIAKRGDLWQIRYGPSQRVKAEGLPKADR
jgi:hypothetical protein